MRINAAGLALCAVAISLAADCSAVPTVDEGWVITSFHSDINIGADSTLTVTEDIRVDFGSLQKHGIFRTFPVRYRYDDTRDRIFYWLVLSVTDGSSPLQFTNTSQGGYQTLKIGDPNQTVSGPQRYVISYRVIGAMNAFSDHDELFWNVDGDMWPVRKQSVTATVHLPRNSFQKAACDQGPTGSTEKCTSSAAGDTVDFNSTRELGLGEQMSVVTAFNQGAVAVPAPILDSRLRLSPLDLFDINPVTVGLSLLIFLVGAGLIARFWWLHGRDHAYLTQYYLTNNPAEHVEPVFHHEPVVAEFGPPQNLRPALLGLILDESADTKDVTATIVDLAVRGYLTISEVPGQKDWLLTWNGGAGADLLPYEKTLLDGLFVGRQQVKISELKGGTFQPTLRTAEGQIYADPASRKFFTIRPDSLHAAWIGIAGVTVFAGIVATLVLGSKAGFGLLGVALVLVGLLLVATYRFISTRSAAGRDVLQHTLGFRLYMNTAEKYRQQFAEKAEIFTQLLPYAIVFGCVGRWAKAFEGIDTSATNSWYVGGGPFQATLLAGNLESMNSGLSGAIGSSPAGSGSGFGGGAGGGGGGGGGGSW